MRVLASSGDLLTSLTYAVSHPLAEDLHELSLEGVESVYGVLLKYTEPALPMRIVTMTLVTEGLLAAVLDKTLMYCQKEASLTNVNAAEILLTLSLRVPTTDAKIRTELSQVVPTLRCGRTKPCQDLLAGWLHAALFKFPWLMATIQKANITPLLLYRAGVACHTSPVTPKVLFESAEAMRTLSYLCQDFSYCCEVFNASYPSLLSIVDNARLLLNSRFISHTTSTTTRIGEVAQSILFAGIGCVKIRTNP